MYDRQTGFEMSIEILIPPPPPPPSSSPRQRNLTPSPPPTHPSFDSDHHHISPRTLHKYLVIVTDIASHVLDNSLDTIHVTVLIYNVHRRCSRSACHEG